MDPKKLEEHLQKESLDYVLGDEKGRAFLWRLLSITGVYHDIAVGDPHLTAHALGRRSVGLQLLGILNDHNEGLVLKMTAESRKLSVKMDELYKEKEKNDAKAEESVGNTQYFEPI